MAIGYLAKSYLAKAITDGPLQEVVLMSEDIEVLINDVKDNLQLDDEGRGFDAMGTEVGTFTEEQIKTAIIDFNDFWSGDSLTDAIGELRKAFVRAVAAKLAKDTTATAAGK